jgi:endonuclease/exonuclease/phosphatase family metal-dependent hydrolase
MRLFNSICLATLALLLFCCKPKIATTFNDEEEAEIYYSAIYTEPETPDSSINMMTWNVRFGIGRSSFWGDACGTKTIYTQDEVRFFLDSIIEKINTLKPDILNIQELDLDSKRTSYLNELQYILDRTYFNYAYYGSIWRSEFVPVGGLGKIELGLATFSRWPLKDAKRVQLALRDDQDAVTQKMYLRYCYVKGEVEIPGFKPFTVLNIHSLAFTNDDTKQKQMKQVLAELDQLDAAGKTFVIGGDFNNLPPNATKIDYCLEEACGEEHFHGESDDPKHKEGSNYEPDLDLLSPFFSKYSPDVTLSDYLANESIYFTQTNDPNISYDKKIDFFFTNYQWIPNSTVIHHEMNSLSDHAAISIQFRLKQ